MFRNRNVRVEDVETVARIMALDHDDDPDKGYRMSSEHTLNHLENVPQHCYVVDNDNKHFIAVMILHS